MREVGGGRNATLLSLLRKGRDCLDGPSLRRAVPTELVVIVDIDIPTSLLFPSHMGLGRLTPGCKSDTMELRRISPIETARLRSRLAFFQRDSLPKWREAAMKLKVPLDQPPWLCWAQYAACWASESGTIYDCIVKESSFQY